MKFLYFIYFLSLLTLSITRAKEIEVECDVTEENFTSASCSVTTTVCNIRDVNLSSNTTKLKFINRDLENVTSIVSIYIELKRFPSEIFDQFTNLVHVRIYNAGIKEIPSNSFRRAQNLMELNLERNIIEEITEATFVGAGQLLTLNLRNNAIKRVPAHVFRHLGDLEYLDLTKNKIVSVDVMAFSDLNHLKTLELGFNSIKTLDPTTFVHNENLLFLNLQDNLMEEVVLEFDDVQLHKLNLKHCNARKVSLRKSPGSQQSPCYIEKLYINYNKIQKLSNISIDDSIIVNKLELESCGLMTLHNNQAFWRNIQELSLVENEMTELPSQFLDRLENIKKLILNENPQLVLKENMFSKLKTLKWLSLRYNQLSSVDPAWFNGLSNLKMLDLKSNFLSTLDYRTLVKLLPSLRTIDVDYNNFDCDDLKGMMSYLKTFTNVRIKESSDVEFEKHRYQSMVYGVLCGVEDGPQVDFYWMGAGVVIVVALITSLVLFKKDSCKICRGNTVYDDMEIDNNGEAGINVNDN